MTIYYSSAIFVGIILAVIYIYKKQKHEQKQDELRNKVLEEHTELVDGVRRLIYNPMFKRKKNG